MVQGRQQNAMLSNIPKSIGVQVRGSKGDDIGRIRIRETYSLKRLKVGLHQRPDTNVLPDALRTQVNRIGLPLRNYLTVGLGLNDRDPESRLFEGRS
jgi:hypothetical protein